MIHLETFTTFIQYTAKIYYTILEIVLFYNLINLIFKKFLMDLFYGFFNIFLGIIMILVSLGRIKPSKPVTQGWINFFKIAGVILLIGGMIKLYVSFCS